MQAASIPEDLSWWQRALQLLLAPIVLPVSLLVVGIPLLIIVLVSLPFSAFHRWAALRRDDRLEDRLASEGRCLRWQELKHLIARKGGTLIVEVRHKDCPKLWWTEDDMRNHFAGWLPCLEEAMEELFTPGSIDDFTEWCYDRYLVEPGGKAILCQRSSASLRVAEISMTAEELNPKTGVAYVPSLHRAEIDGRPV
ncbi:hypothetical protein [Aeoliella mucimassa]|uniref:Uncharacterized protein n=1 Tax=Aeoliella mucimassa TaxID=2527972 RepID=A0A518AV58_9BACT|nr:hypothetical protein [Aeoliella mucimassa]QDU58617.1 hypothetical protein Pan181_48560 [Aeoliella mucimassa]